MPRNVFGGQGSNIVNADWGNSQWNKGDIKQLEKLKESYFVGAKLNRTAALENLKVDAARLAKDSLVQKLINCVTSSQSKEPFIKAVLVAFVLSHESKAGSQDKVRDVLRESVEVIFSHCPKNAICSAKKKNKDGVDLIFVLVGARDICFGESILDVDVNRMNKHVIEYSDFVTAMKGEAQGATLNMNDECRALTFVDTVTQAQSLELKLDEIVEHKAQDVNDVFLAVDSVDKCMVSERCVKSKVELSFCGEQENPIQIPDSISLSGIGDAVQIFAGSINDEGAWRFNNDAQLNGELEVKLRDLGRDEWEWLLLELYSVLKFRVETSDLDGATIDLRDFEGCKSPVGLVDIDSIPFIASLAVQYVPEFDWSDTGKLLSVLVEFNCARNAVKEVNTMAEWEWEWE